LDSSRGRAKRHLAALLKKHSAADLLTAVKNYGIASDGTEPKFRRNSGNFFGRDGDFENFLPGVFQDEASRQSEAYYLAHKTEIDAMENEIAQEAALAASGRGQAITGLPAPKECSLAPRIDDFDPFGDYDQAAIDAVLEADR
jgi:hypothetical protein